MVKNKKCHSKKMAALVTAVVLAVSAAVSFAVPQVKAANGPCAVSYTHLTLPTKA